MPSSHLILCHPILLRPPILPSIRVFSNESALRIRLPEYWSFSFSISPSKEHPGLISFRMDWLDLLAVQGTLKSLLQHHSSKASILRRSHIHTLKCYVSFCCTTKQISHMYLSSVLDPTPFPKSGSCRSPQSTELSSLCYTAGPHSSLFYMQYCIYVIAGRFFTSSATRETQKC